MRKLAQIIGSKTSKILNICIAALLLSGVAVNLANVIGRYFFASPLPWGEEVLTYLLVWIVFLGVGAVAWDGKHLRVDVLVLALPRSLKSLVGGIGAVATLAVCIFMFVQASRMVALFLANDQVSLVAEIQLEVPHGAVSIGFGMMILLLLLRFLSRRHVSMEETPSGIENVDDAEVQASKTSSAQTPRKYPLSRTAATQTKLKAARSVE